MYPKYKLRHPVLFSLYPWGFYKWIKCIGHTADMDDYEKRKLGVFNQVNFLGIIVGFMVSVSGLFDDQKLPPIASVVAISPVFISTAVLIFNYYKRHEVARIIYFSLYPVLTSLVYGAGMDLGLELFFILYAVLAVFYMDKPSNAVFSFVLAAGCYMTVYVFAGNYFYVLRTTSFNFYVFVHLLGLSLIFFAVYWLKKENVGYQLSILNKNTQLNATNLEIESQKKEIIKKASELEDLNLLKNKLFSVISHDLKGPIYAQRNLFANIEKYDLPVEDIKLLVPEILKEMNFTLNLMDNLLQWSKSQMNAQIINQELLDTSTMVNDAVNLIRLQAKTKGINLTIQLNICTYVYADKNMIDLVLRNLISNAVKFTCDNNNVAVTVNEINSDVEIGIIDNGVGMTHEEIEKISQNIFYSSKGTANESGTGLGLMLCQDFLRKNGSALQIKSQVGKGSTFYFRLPNAK
jgi:two-component system sensor histidine kinase/response regulator